MAARLGAVLAAGAVIAVAIVMLERGPRPAAAPSRPAAGPVGAAATTAPGGGSPAHALTEVPAGPLGALEGGVPEAGKPAPNFALADLAGDRVELADLRGKVVIVNFWATWCGPCRQEFPELQKAAVSQGAGVVVLALDQAESAGKVAQFRDQFGATFTILLDSSNAVADSYRFSGIPDTVFIDRTGIVRDVVRGPLSAGSFRYKISQLLNAP